MTKAAVARSAGRTVLVLALLAETIAAQKSPGPSPVFAPGAEAALGKGRFAVAESLLYAASERAPHDAGLRAGLGMYLASRGHIKIGTVLLEEARKFGANAALVDEHLAQMYPWINDWSSRAALSRNVLSPAERAQAKWLSVHAPGALGLGFRCRCDGASARRSKRRRPRARPHFDRHWWRDDSRRHF